MTGILAFIQGIDWAAALLTLILISGGLCPWLMLRNMVIPDMLIRIVHEEGAWLDQHHEYQAKTFKRYDAMPSYGRILFSLWKPVKQFEAELKPVAEYYKETK
jgi:hypothetical protein